jgi:hypothetical protein
MKSCDYFVNKREASMMNITRVILFIISIILIILLSPIVLAEVNGRWDVGTYSWIPDEKGLEDRISLLSRLHFNWIQSADGWVFRSDLKIREEESNTRLQIWELRMDYGLNKKPFAASFGLCDLDHVTGLGGVLGSECQLNLVPSFHFGLFGGANPVFEEGSTKADGVKLGGYANFDNDSFGSAGLGYVTIRNTDTVGDERDYFAFDTQCRFLEQKIVFYQSGEYQTSSGEKDSKNKLAYYLGTLTFITNDRVSFDLSYDHFDQTPLLQVEQDAFDHTTPDDEIESHYIGDSISPRVNFRISKTWRTFFRYQYRKTDIFEEVTANQYLGGLSCSDVLKSGLYFNGIITVNRSDQKDYQSGYVCIGHDYGAASLSVFYSADRFLYPESLLITSHVKSTSRTGFSFMYRLSHGMSLLLDYEHSLGDYKVDQEHRLLVNFQYRF